MDTKECKIAVLIDSDNVPYANIKGMLDEIAKYGNKIVGFYFKNINTLRQNKDRSFADSEKDGFVHKTYNVNARQKKETIANRYNEVIENKNNSQNTTTSTSQPKKIEEGLVYNEFWMGEYTQKDIDLLDKYYAGLNRDYKIVTENHRDYGSRNQGKGP